MASIRKRGNSYLLVVSMGYDYRGNRIKPVQKTVHPPEGFTPKQVEKWLDEQALLFEMEVKHERQPVDRNITLAKYIALWLRDIGPTKLALSTFTREKQDIERILPCLGHLKLIDLKAEILRDFYDRMRQAKNKNTGKPLAEKTVEGIHACLCGILSDAVEGGYLAHNPAWRAYKSKSKPKERIIADEELVQKLIACLEQESLKYEIFFKLILLTGMRRGECCGLKWNDINWRQRSIHIQRNIVKVSHTPVEEKAPKTAAGDRVVFFSKEMSTLLKEYQKECVWQIGQIGEGELTDADFLFRQQGGTPMTPTTFTWRFNIILKKYGLPKQLTVHSLRHTNASLLIAEGVDVRTVAGLLGHAQPSTTLDIYSHAFDKKKKEAQERLGRVLEI